MALSYPSLSTTKVYYYLVPKTPPNIKYHWNEGFKHLAAGLCCGVSALGAGLAIGIVGDAGVRANAQQDAVFVGMVLILIFAEALGLYGMIVAIILAM